MNALSVVDYIAKGALGVGPKVSYNEMLATLNALEIAQNAPRE